MTIMKMRVDIIGRGIFAWISLCSILLLNIITKSTGNPFFQIGPNRQLSILHIAIDTYPKYFTVILYTTCSTVVRTLQQEVLTPWIIQNIQNDKPKSAFANKIAYEITTIEVVYRWFDWFMYMNILLAQVDMMIVEVLGNILASWATTHIYLSSNTRIPLAQSEIT